MAKDVAGEVSHRTEVAAEELSNMVVTSLKNVNKTASEAFVNFRDAKLVARKKPKPKPVGDKAMISQIWRTVPIPEGFHFYNEKGDPTGKIAISLPDFLEIVKTVDVRSVNFHFNRGDFEKWIIDVFSDIELATQISKIRKDARGERLRNDIIRIINRRLEELNKLKA